MRCTVYERHEVVNLQGQIVERHERGDPFVFRKGLGRVPINAQDPFLDDGSGLSQTTLGYSDAQGRFHRVVRHERHPGPPPGLTMCGQERPALLSAEQQRRILSHLMQDQQDSVPVAILLRDRQLAHRLPARGQTGLAFLERHRADTLGPLRRRLRAENQQQRLREAAPFKAWIRSIGGRVTHHATLYGSLLSAQIPRRHLKALLARPEVVHVEPRVFDSQGEGGVTTSYLCSNLPTRLNGRDEPDCIPKIHSDGTLEVAGAYLDAVNAATGALAYADAGYTGLTAGGLANWGHHPWFTSKQKATLTYGIRDGDPMDVNHPAFLWYGRSRFIFRLDASSDDLSDGSGGGEEDAGTDDILVKVEADIAGITTPDDDEGHATRCAAVAMANSTLRGDSALTSADAREARTGVARLVSGLAAIRHVQTYEMLDVIHSGTRMGTDEDGDPFEGIDVISSSYKEGHGSVQVGKANNGGDLRCPSEDDARGLDFSSMHIVYAFQNDQVVFTKAGGNDHGVIYANCTEPGDAASEVSPPGASAAAISSSALDTATFTATEIQAADRLRDDSDRETTPDQRSYPLLASPAQTCGCAGTSKDLYGRDESYELHGQTSATAPRVAGSALIFKHWYLEQYGSIANFAGRIIVNILNFADGYALGSLGAHHGIGRVDPPAPGWGLGRLRLRLYSDAQNDSGPHWGTTSRGVYTGAWSSIDLTDGAGTLPVGIRHLRITAWWLEVNTGVDAAGVAEPKSEIDLYLSYKDSTGAWVTDTVGTSTEHVLRMQYDRDDTTFSCPPSGEVYLSLYARSVPMEQRSSVSAGGPTYAMRVVHVAWLWELGEDPTTITCPGAGATVSTRCGTSVPDPSGGDSGDISSLTAEDSADLHAARLAAERVLRDTLRIATGLAPSAGCGPCFEARRPLSPHSTG